MSDCIMNALVVISAIELGTPQSLRYCTRRKCESFVCVFICTTVSGIPLARILLIQYNLCYGTLRSQGHPLMSHSPDDGDGKTSLFYFNAVFIADLSCFFICYFIFATFHYCEIYYIAIFIIYARFDFILSIFSI